MGKNKAMLKSFYKVMTNDLNEINKILPDMYAKNFYTIDFEYLLGENLKKLIIDIDGTILKVDDVKVPESIIQKFKQLKELGFEMCLVSNNENKRVKPVAEILNVKYLAKANKPLKEAFDNALKKLNTKDKTEVAMIGDQMMSDIKGSNEYGIYSILVKPVSKHNNIKTGTSRFLQNIMEKHLKKQNMFNKNEYYKKGRK